VLKEKSPNDHTDAQNGYEWREENGSMRIMKKIRRGGSGIAGNKENCSADTTKKIRKKGQQAHKRPGT